MIIASRRRLVSGRPGNQPFGEADLLRFHRGAPCALVGGMEPSGLYLRTRQGTLLKLRSRFVFNLRYNGERCAIILVRMIKVCAGPFQSFFGLSDQLPAVLKHVLHLLSHGGAPRLAIPDWHRKPAFQRRLETVITLCDKVCSHMETPSRSSRLPLLMSEAPQRLQLWPCVIELCFDARFRSRVSSVWLRSASGR